MSSRSEHISQCPCSCGLQSHANVLLPLTDVCVHALSFCLLKNQNSRVSIIDDVILLETFQMQQ